MKSKMTLLIGALMIVHAGSGYAADHDKEGVMMPLEQVDWRLMAPDSKIQWSVLHGDPSVEENVRIFKMPPGTVIPLHMHTSDAHAVALGGVWRHSFKGGEQMDLTAGAYVFMPAELMHDDICVGPDECIIWVYQSGAADYIPIEE